MKAEYRDGGMPMIQRGEITPQALSDALMRDVYYPFSACVCLDAGGGVLSLRLFDTAYCPRMPDVTPGAGEVWLISSHPEGEPTDEDRHWAARLREASDGATLRTFLTNEDEGCREIAY